MKFGEEVGGHITVWAVLQTSLPITAATITPSRTAVQPVPGPKRTSNLLSPLSSHYPLLPQALTLVLSKLKSVVHHYWFFLLNVLHPFPSFCLCNCQTKGQPCFDVPRGPWESWVHLERNTKAVLFDTKVMLTTQGSLQHCRQL